VAAGVLKAIATEVKSFWVMVKALKLMAAPVNKWQLAFLS